MLSAKICTLLDLTGFTQKKLGDLIGVPPQRIKNLVSGRVQKLTQAEAQALVAKLGVRSDWLLTGEGPVFQEEGERELARRLRHLSESSRAAQSLASSGQGQRIAQQILQAHALGDEGRPLLESAIAAIDHLAQEAEEAAWVPLVRARLSAGSGSLETDDDVEARYAFRREWVSRKGNAGRLVLMKITGDSMEPELRDGDMALIDQTQRDVIAGGYYAVGIEDVVMVKQLDSRPGKLILRSLNPAYPPVEVDLRGDLADGVRIIGRVIWWCREAR